jgi:hypothetical protein
MRGPLAVWAVMQLLALEVARTMSFPVNGDSVQHWEVWIGGTFILFVVIAWMSAYFFAAIPLHEDSVAGGEAWWQTRPASRLQLLGAKLLGLAVFFGLLPVLLRLFCWQTHGFSLREMALAAVETLQTSLGVAALAFALASITSTVAQFYRWTLGAVVLVIVMLLWLLFTRSGNYAISDLANRSMAWPDLLTALTTPLLLVTIGQFLAPNRQRTALLVAVFVLAVLFMGTLPVAPFNPQLHPDLSASVTGTNLSAAKISIAPKSGMRAFVTLKEASVYSGSTSLGRVLDDGETPTLSAAAGYFSQSPDGKAPPAIYGLALNRGSRVQASQDMTVRAKGALWEPEYVMDVPLVGGRETVQGSRRLRIEYLVVGRPDDAAPQDPRDPLLLPGGGPVVVLGGIGGAASQKIRGRLVLRESLPVLGTKERFRPEGLSEFYVLVMPSGWKRIIADFSGIFVSSNVGTRISFFPITEDDLGRLPDGSPAPASAARIVKVGLRRLGSFDETVPLQWTTQKP